MTRDWRKFGACKHSGQVRSEMSSKKNQLLATRWNARAIRHGHHVSGDLGITNITSRIQVESLFFFSL